MRLNDNLNELERTANIGAWFYGVAIGGVGLTLYGLYGSGLDSDPNYTMVIAGCGIMTLGMIIAPLIIPGESDFRTFINRHNNLKDPQPKNKIELKLGSRYEKYDIYSKNYNQLYYAAIKYRL